INRLELRAIRPDERDAEAVPARGVEAGHEPVGAIDEQQFVAALVHGLLVDERIARPGVQGGEAATGGDPEGATVSGPGDPHTRLDPRLPTRGQVVLQQYYSLTVELKQSRVVRRECLHSLHPREPYGSRL